MKIIWLFDFIRFREKYYFSSKFYRKYAQTQMQMRTAE